MNVVVYGTPECTKCESVKAFLKLNEINYRYRSVGADINKEELEGIVDRLVRSVPVITVDGLEIAYKDVRTLRAA